MVAVVKLGEVPAFLGSPYPHTFQAGALLESLGWSIVRLQLPVLYNHGVRTAGPTCLQVRE
jgi:hypothetical protein